MTEMKNIHVIPHSHWDREWYMPFEYHRARLIELIDNCMELFEKDKNICKKRLTKPSLSDKIHHVPNGTYALVAQLDRVTDYESVGRGFESLPSHQKMP